MIRQFHSCLGIYPKKTKILIGRDTGTPMFIVALFTIAKVWKQPMCPSVDEWIKKYDMIHNTHIYTQWYISHKKDEILPFAKRWMDLECIMLSEVSQTKKDIQHDFTYMWNKKQNKTNEQTKQNRNRVTDTGNKLLVVVRREGTRGSGKTGEGY